MGKGGGWREEEKDGIGRKVGEAGKGTCQLLDQPVLNSLLTYLHAYLYLLLTYLFVAGSRRCDRSRAARQLAVGVPGIRCVRRKRDVTRPLREIRLRRAQGKSGKVRKCADKVRRGQRVARRQGPRYE